MEDPDNLQTISGNDVIMAYDSQPQTFERQDSYMVQHSSDRRACSCLFWSRYILFVINFVVLAAGGTMIALGSWALMNDEGLDLFRSVLVTPSWLLVATGCAMVVLGVAGCAGALRLNVRYLRLFMVLVVVCTALQVGLAASVFLTLEDVEHEMTDILQDVMGRYIQDSGAGDDLALDYIQREFDCCGATSYQDWESNLLYNCSNSQAVTSCGVPSSCCLGTRDAQCGYGVRGSTEAFAAMFSYTEGCVITLMDIFEDNILVVVGLAFAVSFLEMCSLALANYVVRTMVLHEKLLPAET